MKKYFAKNNLVQSPRYVLVIEHDWGSGARCLLLIYRSTCCTDKSQSQREAVCLQPDSDACFSVFIWVWILGGACPCLNLLVVEWLMFLTVKTERFLKSHANNFESRIHKNSKRGLFKSRVNHFESWASLLPVVTKANTRSIEIRLLARFWMRLVHLGEKCRVEFNIWYGKRKREISMLPC